MEKIYLQGPVQPNSPPLFISKLCFEWAKALLTELFHTKNLHKRHFLFLEIIDTYIYVLFPCGYSLFPFSIFLISEETEREIYILYKRLI